VSTCAELRVERREKAEQRKRAREIQATREESGMQILLIEDVNAGLFGE
jgi:hypothetical protein